MTRPVKNKPFVNIRATLLGDEGLIDVQDVQKNRQGLQMVRELLAHGGASTIVVDHKVMAVGGVAQIWPGRAVAWGYVDKSLPRRAWPRVNKLVRDMLALHKDTARIECWVRCDPPGLWHFAAKLGFAQESVLRRFDGKNDYYMGVLSWAH